MYKWMKELSPRPHHVEACQRQNQKGQSQQVTHDVQSPWQGQKMGLEHLERESESSSFPCVRRVVSGALAIQSSHSITMPGKSKYKLNYFPISICLYSYILPEEEGLCLRFPHGPHTAVWTRWTYTFVNSSSNEGRKIKGFLPSNRMTDKMITSSLWPNNSH